MEARKGLAVPVALAAGLGSLGATAYAPLTEAQDRKLAALTFTMNVGKAGDKKKGEVGWDSARFTFKAGKVDEYNIGTEVLGLTYAPSGPTEGIDIFVENGSYNGIMNFGQRDGDNQLYYGVEDRFSNNLQGLIARLGTGGDDMASARLTLASTRQDNYGKSELAPNNSYSVFSFTGDGITPDFSLNNLLVGLMQCMSIEQVNDWKRRSEEQRRKENAQKTQQQIIAESNAWHNSEEGRAHLSLNDFLRDKYGASGQEAIDRFWAAKHGREGAEMQAAATKTWLDWYFHRNFVGGDWQDCIGAGPSCSGTGGNNVIADVGNNTNNGNNNQNNSNNQNTGGGIGDDD